MRDFRSLKHLFWLLCIKFKRMSLTKGACLVEEIGYDNDLYLSMGLWEVHNETEENAFILQAVRVLVPIIPRPKTIVISLSCKLRFFCCNIFLSFLLCFGSLVFATVYV